MNRETGWNLDNSYARLPQLFFTNQLPTPVSSPRLVIMNHALAASLGLNLEELQSEEGIAVLAGNRTLEGSVPIAQAYAGHQFGHFTMLGDGRAVLLGEQITTQKERFDIQLKGSGRTPYSRGGDGRAALGPMLREYLISEAMVALGIPTSRSLAVVTTGETVTREKELTGAILTRIAASHLRIGTFEFVAALRQEENLRILADYAIKRHYPEIETNENRYLAFLEEVIKRQAALIANWQLVGFIHGVMNTDNMTISGETIDYGPCAFIDIYDPTTVFSSIDRQGRYAYGNQPAIASWNLARLATALLPLIHENEEQAIRLAEEELSRFARLFEFNFFNGMRAKLGIFNEEVDDGSLIEELLSLLQEHQEDYTNTFRALTLGEIENTQLFSSAKFAKWNERWQARLTRQSEGKSESEQLMRKSNPAIIPRNHRVEEALKAAVENGDYTVIERFLEVLAQPFDYTADQADYCQLPKPSKHPYRTFCGT